MTQRAVRFLWLMALGALVGCGTVPHGAAQGGGHGRRVPWAALAGQVPQAGMRVAAAPTLLSAPACQPQNLQVVSVGPNQATQDDGVEVVLKNAGPRACVAWGPTSVVATGLGLAPVTGPVRPMPSYGDRVATPPGGQVVERIDALVACPSNPGGVVPPGRVYQAVRLTVGTSAHGPATGSITVSGLHLSLPCGISASPFYANKPTPAFNPGPVGHLEPSLSGPLTLTRVAGQPALTYTLTLANPTALPIRLVPCPSYLERVSTGKWTVYRLNCQEARSVPAHGAERFAMVLLVPKDAIGQPVVSIGEPVEVEWMLPLPVLGPVARIAGRVVG